MALPLVPLAMQGIWAGARAAAPHIARGAKWAAPHIVKGGKAVGNTIWNGTKAVAKGIWGKPVPGRAPVPKPKPRRLTARQRAAAHEWYARGQFK